MAEPALGMTENTITLSRDSMIEISEAMYQMAALCAHLLINHPEDFKNPACQAMQQGFQRIVDKVDIAIVEVGGPLEHR